MDEYIFTALYPIDMHIDIRNLTGKIPYEPIFYLDDEYKPKNWSKFANYPKPKTELSYLKQQSPSTKKYSKCQFI